MTGFTLNRKTAIVTGATSGIGLAIVQKLASEGCDVVLVARDAKALAKTATQIKKKWKVRAVWYVADVTKGEQLLAVVKQIKTNLISVDFLVNNAGGSHVTAPNDRFDSAFMQDLELNLVSTHLCCRLLSGLVKKGGAVVNLSSLNGQTVTMVASAKQTAKMGYAAAKAGVIQLTRLYAAQLAGRCIRVNAVAPGGIYPTGMTGDWTKEKQQKIAAETPLKRLGTTQDIANAVYFLISDLSSFMTGQTLSVNGGRYMN